MVRTIPEEDLKLINDSFKHRGAVDTLVKKGNGSRINAVRKQSNEKTITFQDFSGKVLKHQKSIVILGGGQLIIGVKGQRYDDIPLDDRKFVIWDESDFV